MNCGIISSTSEQGEERHEVRKVSVWWPRLLWQEAWVLGAQEFFSKGIPLGMHSHGGAFSQEAKAGVA